MKLRVNEISQLPKAGVIYKQPDFGSFLAEQPLKLIVGILCG